MKKIVPLVVGASLLVPGAAMADGTQCSSQGQTYGSQSCQATSNALQSTATTSTASGTLPFTGLDVGLLVAGGGTLLGAGLIVRRLSRDTTE